jgi:serine/threonine protein kinase
MSEAPSLDSTQIREAVDRFERAWKAGVKRPIEDFVAKADEPKRTALLRELLRVERSLREQANEKPDPNEYRTRFPRDRAIVDGVFAPEPKRAKEKPSIEPSKTMRAARDAPPSPAHTIPPELASIADYRFIRELGGGNMGRVFLAHNQIMGRDEVLKLIKRNIIDTPGVLERFYREIRAVAKLRHPNIVTAYMGFRAGESLVFAMEYVDGLDLARIVDAKGPIPVSNACSFAHQAALGLQHAHKAGLVHRDIKPGNLMLAREGDRAIIKILDFGLAKAGLEQDVLDQGPDGARSAQGQSNDLTAVGQMMGTPSYIAPEQIVNSQKADIRADIYSLGCTLYYLLSGRPPFEGAKMDVLRAHRSSVAQPLNLVRPEVPAELADVVAKMIAKKPNERFQEPAEVAEALKPFFKSKIVAAKQATPGNVPNEQAGKSDETTDPIAELRGLEPKWQGAVELDVNVDEEWDTTEATEVKVTPTKPPWFLSAIAGSGGLAAILTLALLAAYYFGFLAGKWELPQFGHLPGNDEPPAQITGPGGRARSSSSGSSTPNKAKTVVPKAEAETAKPIKPAR